MSNETKQAIYRAARQAGAFKLARRLSRKRSRILGYHGFARYDEAQFRSKLFIRPDTFRARLEFLRGHRFRVVSLDDAIAQLKRGLIEPDTVAITIDDGFATTLLEAAPLLREYGCPATVYLTSYHMDKQTPVFDLVVAYLIWKSTRDSVTVDGSLQPAVARLDLTSDAAKRLAAERLVDIGRGLASEAQRVQLSRAIGQAVGVDYDAVVAAGSFRLLSFDEARTLRGMKIDVGLHTHRHRFPSADPSLCRVELDENRRILERELGGRFEHFCYPSGIYSTEQWPLLRDLGIASATTCDTGLVRAEDSPFGLRRFLNGEMVTDIEFEAELYGFAELLRRAAKTSRTSVVR